MLDIWNYKPGSPEWEEWNSIYNAEPVELFLITVTTFVHLRDLINDATCGSRPAIDDDFRIHTELPVYAIAAYCDAKTSIDSQFIIQALHAVQAEARKKPRTYSGDGFSPYGPRKTDRELQSLLYNLHATQQRLANHLFSVMCDQEREEAQRAIEQAEPHEIWSPVMSRDRLCRILAPDGKGHISKKQLYRMLEGGEIRAQGDHKGQRKLVVMISDLDRLNPAWREIV
jgi:hypothetical protein